MSAELLVAVREAGQCSLWAHERAIAYQVTDFYACNGSGQDVGRYVGNTLHDLSMTTRWGFLVATHLLQQAKRASSGCGGDSDIAIIPTDGLAEVRRPSKQLEENFDKVYASLRTTILTAVGDLENTQALERKMPQVQAGLRNSKAQNFHLKKL